MAPVGLLHYLLPVESTWPLFPVAQSWQPPFPVVRTVLRQLPQAFSEGRAHVSLDLAASKRELGAGHILTHSHGTCTNALTCVNMHRDSFRQTHAHTRHSHAHTFACTDIQAHAYTPTHSHTQAYAHTYAYIVIHTRSLRHSFTLLLT